MESSELVEAQVVHRFSNLTPTIQYHCSSVVVSMHQVRMDHRTGCVGLVQEIRELPNLYLGSHFDSPIHLEQTELLSSNSIVPIEFLRHLEEHLELHYLAAEQLAVVVEFVVGAVVDFVVVHSNLHPDYPELKASDLDFEEHFAAVQEHWDCLAGLVVLVMMRHRLVVDSKAAEAPVEQEHPIVLRPDYYWSVEDWQ